VLARLCVICVLTGFATRLPGAPIERFDYRFERAGSGAANLAPTTRIAVFLATHGDEAAVRADLGAAGVDGSGVELSMLAGVLLVSTADLNDTDTRAVYDKLLANASVEYVAPVYAAPNGTAFAVAPSLSVIGGASRGAEVAGDAGGELRETETLRLDERNGLNVLALRQAIAARRDVAATDLNWLQVSARRHRFVVPEDSVSATRYADGRAVRLSGETVWRSMCGSPSNTMPIEQLRHEAEVHAAAAQQALREGAAGGVAAAVPGVDINFAIASAVPDGALDAIAAVEAYLESQFDDPIVVTITLRFATLDPGVLGATGSSYVLDSYADVRDALQADMDFDDSIQNYLPAGNSIPVRYDGNSETVTQESRVYVTRANYNAAVGAVGGSAASMTFNTNFAWDFTPPFITSGQYDFQSVLAHEVGHALGFTSGADFRTSDLEMLDLYRFQRSDGTGTDHNPDTLEEFQTEPRMVDQNAPGVVDDVNSDLISVEYQMSDGQPRQASHFHDQTPPIGIMDPTMSSGQTFYPDFLRQADDDMFDAIGWDFPSVNVCYLDAPTGVIGESSKNRYIAFDPPNAGTSVAVKVTLVALLAPDGGALPGSPDYSAFVGQTRWLDTPMAYLDSPSQGTTFLGAGLSCDPVCVDLDNIDAIQLYGGEILPDSIYELRAARCTCNLADETVYSDPLMVVTGHWGDVALPFFSALNPSQPDFNDIAAIVDKFVDGAASLTKPNIQLQPNLVDPGASVSFKDIAVGVEAFVSGIYPHEGPCTCPSAVTCGATACTNDTTCGGGYCIEGFCTDACGRCAP